MLMRLVLRYLCGYSRNRVSRALRCSGFKEERRVTVALGACISLCTSSSRGEGEAGSVILSLVVSSVLGKNKGSSSSLSRSSKTTDIFWLQAGKE